MRNLKHILMAVTVLLVITFMASQTMATDVMITGKLTSVSQKVSKNGNPYVLLTLPEQKELNGIKYISEASVFCFNPTPEAKALKSGDIVKLIAKRSNSNGSEFTTLISIVK